MLGTGGLMATAKFFLTVQQQTNLRKTLGGGGGVWSVYGGVEGRGEEREGGGVWWWCGVVCGGRVVCVGGGVKWVCGCGGGGRKRG